MVKSAKRRIEPLSNDSPILRVLLCESGRQCNKLRLSGIDRDEYQSAFFLKFLELPPRYSTAYRLRAAQNAAIDVLRQESRRRRYECLSDVGIETEAEIVQSKTERQATITTAGEKSRVHSPDASPEAAVVCKEFYQQILTAACSLTSAQRVLFELCFIDCCTAMEASEVTGRTPQAIRQALCLIRARLRKQLEQHGFDSNTAIDYISMMNDYE